MVNITKTEKEIEEAKAKKEEEELKVQIEVYEGQSYEARQAYEKAQEKYTATRRKLPKDIPTDKDYKEQDLQAQYIQARVISPTQEKQVKEYRAEIEKQQKASKSVQVLNKELPQLYSSAVQEVESVKTGVEKAKQKVADKYDPIIQTKTKAVETEKARRAKQFADVQTAYKEALSNNPYTQEKGSVRRRELEHGRHFNVTRFNYKWSQQSQNYIKQAKQAKIEAERNIRYEHLALEGRSLKSVAPNAGFNWDEYNRQEMWRLDARELNPSYHGGNLILAVARENYLRGMYDFQTYSQIAGGGSRAVKAEKEAQAERARAKSKAQLAGAIAKDRAHWASVANDPTTKQLGGSKPTGLSSASNVTVTDKTPMVIYKPSGEIIIPSLTKTDKYHEYDGKIYKTYLTAYEEKLEKETPLGIKQYNSNPMLQGTGTLDIKKGTSHYTSGQINSKDYQAQVNAYASNVQKQQRVTEIANEKQSTYTNELRAGNVGLASALLNPQTTQKYYGTNTRNLKTFLKERGYDLSKPDSIPNSVLTSPEKYKNVRGMGSGDMRTQAPYFAGFSSSGQPTYSYPLASPEVQQRRFEARQKWEGITVPQMPSNPLVAPPPKPKPVTQKKKSKPVPKWTFNQQGFSDKSKLDAYVQSRYTQAKSQTALTTIQNIQSNKTGKLNPVGFIDPLTDSISYNSNPILNKPIEKSVTNASKPIERTDSSNIPSSYTGDIFSVTNPLTGVTKQFRTEEKAQKFVDKVNKDIAMIPDPNNPLPPKPQWGVMTTESQSLPTITGETYQSTGTKEIKFDSYKEAQAYQEFLVKSDKKFQAIFTGADDDLINYSYNVRTGVLPEPTTLEEHVKLKLSQVQEPFANTAKLVNNMLGGKEMQYTETAEEKLISGTINDIASGNPFRGTGVNNAWEEIVKDPSRFVVQLPATGVLYYTGGKAITGATQVTKKGIQLAGQQIDNTIQAGGSLAKPAIIVRGTSQAIDTGVQTVKGAPMKLAKAGYEKVDEYMMKPPTSVTGMYVKQAYGVTKQGVQTIDKKFNYFQDDKVGFGAKAFYVLTPQGKLYVRQVTDIAEDASKNYLKSGKLDVKPVDSDYTIKWTGKDYAEISTPDKVIQITRGQTRIIPKEQGILANESVLTTGGRKGMIAGGYIGSGGKPFGNYKPFKGTQGTKIIPKEADTLRWRLFKGADIDLRASPRQPSLPRGLVKPMEIDSYTVKGASDSFRDRLPYFGRNRQFKTSIEEISVISNPTKRTWQLETTKGDIYIPVKNQLTKNIEIRGDALDRLNLKDAKVISTTTDKGTPKSYSPYTELVPKEGIPKVKGELVPKEGIPKSKFDNIPYADKKKVTGVLVSTTKNKEIIQEAIESGKIVPIGKRTTLTPEEALKSGSGKQVGDNVFKRIATGQKMDDTQVYQTTREITKVKNFEPTLNISPLGKFKQIDPYGATGVVRGMETITGKPPVKYSKPKPNEEITSFGRSGSTTKQVVRETQSKTPLGKSLELEDLKSTPKRKYGSEMKSPYSSAVVGSAVVETINDVTEVPPIDRIRDKDETKIGGKLDTGIGIKMGIQGKIDTVLDPRLKQDPTIKQTPNVRSRVRAKAMTGLKLSQAQAVTQIQPSIIPQITFTRRTETSRKKVPPILPLPELRQRDRKGKGKKGKKAGFIGNVRLDSIVGMYKRQEITYGAKKVRKLERLDMRLTTKTPNRLSTPSSSLLKTRKKKKNKTETILGRTVPKTKDEFAGFKTKKQTKRRKKSTKISLL